ncbi:MAG: DUF2384 domain-containing protein [Candidatus Sericytochromatia bacterium]|nr:DUF2384 domain-containing protein [Candidatus Sericytochromatia bacterium]
MSLLSIDNILGGKEVLGTTLNNRMDFFQLSVTGIPRDSLDYFADYIDFSKKDIEKIFPVSLRTLQRYKNSNKLLDSTISEHLLKLAELVTKGVNVFGEKNKFVIWLNHPNLALSNKKPFELLENQYGIEMVFDELGRIEYGVYS